MFQGPIVHGFKNGRKLGFRTANVQTEYQCEEGVYTAIATRVEENRKYRAIVFVGCSETFAHTKRTYEVHLLHDFEGGEFYGEQLAVQLIEKIRENKKFDSLEELRAQLERDKEYALRNIAAI